jgi:hypothetical protein
MLQTARQLYTYSITPLPPVLSITHPLSLLLLVLCFQLFAVSTMYQPFIMVQFSRIYELAVLMIFERDHSWVTIGPSH